MTQASTQSKRVIIQENLPESSVAGLAQFIDLHYITPKMRFIEKDSLRKTQNQQANLFTFSWKQLLEGRDLSVNLTVSQQVVEVTLDDFDPGDQSRMQLCARTIDEIQNVVWTYFQSAKLTSLYFVLGSAKDHAESPEQSQRNSILRRIFSGNTMNVFILFLLASYIVFLFIGDYAIFLIVALQLIYLFFADRVSLNLGKVRPTEERPLVAIVSVRLTKESVDLFRSVGKSILREIRDQVGQLAISSSEVNGASSAEIKSSIQKIFSRKGITVPLNDIDIKTRNVYDLVKKVAGAFNLPVPKIVIANSVLSNASATGIWSNRAAIMITAGALEDLTDQELESTIGHEMGHVKGHDPLILAGVTSLMYIGAFYLWYPILEVLGLLYYIVAFGVIFAVGKVLETRADTESAVVLQNAQSMASSLTKIDYRDLFQEKYSRAVNFFDWFRFDPHPPIYFRVARMSKLAGVENTVRHTFLDSLRDCIVGFLSSV